VPERGLLAFGAKAPAFVIRLSQRLSLSRPVVSHAIEPFDMEGARRRVGPSSAPIRRKLGL